MEISAITGSAPVLPATPAPAVAPPVENEASERVKDIESREPVNAASAAVTNTQAAPQPYGVHAPAPLNEFQGTRVDLFA